MPNFAGLLKKTIDAQQNPTLQLRARVYARARETVLRKLTQANAPESAIQAQLQALNDAIKSVEADYLAVERELLSSIMVRNPVVQPENRQKETISARNTGSLGNIENINTISESSAFHSRDNIEPEKDRSASRGRPENFPSQSSMRGHEQTTRSSENKSARPIKPNPNANEFFATSRNVPNPEPVDMENVIAAENEAQLLQLEREAQSQKVVANSQQNGDYDIVSDIFVQAARRTERQATRKRVIVTGLSIAAVLLVVVGVLFTAWSFLSGKEKSQDAESSVSRASSNEQPKEKFTQRLLSDGTEVDEGPAKSEPKAGEGTSTAAGTTQEAAPPSKETAGEATLYQARTDTQNEKVETGTVQWSLVKEKATPQHAEEIAVRGNVTIPDEKLSLRLTLRRNTDPSLPAAYLLEVIFIVPDNFEGKAIDNVHELTFKDSEQSTGQQLTGTVEARIGDNFFLFALTGDNPFRDRNLQLMKQLGWMRLVVTDKNQRVLELTFSKGPTGKAIFNEVINTWLEQNKRG